MVCFHLAFCRPSRWGAVEWGTSSAILCVLFLFVGHADTSLYPAMTNPLPLMLAVMAAS